MFKSIISIVFLGAAMAIFFTWTKPYYSEISGLSAQKASLEDVLSSAKQIQEIRDNLLVKYNAIPQENMERLNKFFPSQPNPIKFIIEIENILKKNGMSLKKFDIKSTGDEEKPTFVIEKQPYDTVAFSMKISGPYKSFYSLLSDMEKNLRLVDISNISFSSGESDFYEFDINAVTYWKK